MLRSKAALHLYPKAAFDRLWYFSSSAVARFAVVDLIWSFLKCKRKSARSDSPCDSCGISWHFAVIYEAAFIPEPAAAVRSRGKRDVVGGQRRQTCQRVGCWLAGWHVWSAGLADISCSRLPRGTLCFTYETGGKSVLAICCKLLFERIIIFELLKTCLHVLHEGIRCTINHSHPESLKLCKCIG